jgi:hypothetical protein
MPDEHRSAARVEGAVFGLLIMALGVALLLDLAWKEVVRRRVLEHERVE